MPAPSPKQKKPKPGESSKWLCDYVFDYKADGCLQGKSVSVWCCRWCAQEFNSSKREMDYVNNVWKDVVFDSNAMKHIGSCSRFKERYVQVMRENDHLKTENATLHERNKDLEMKLNESLSTEFDVRTLFDDQATDDDDDDEGTAATTMNEQLVDSTSFVQPGQYEQMMDLIRNMSERMKIQEECLKALALDQQKSTNQILLQLMKFSAATAQSPHGEVVQVNIQNDVQAVTSQLEQSQTIQEVPVNQEELSKELGNLSISDDPLRVSIIDYEKEHEELSDALKQLLTRTDKTVVETATRTIRKIVDTYQTLRKNTETRVVSDYTEAANLTNAFRAPLGLWFDTEQTKQDKLKEKMSVERIGIILEKYPRKVVLLYVITWVITLWSGHFCAKKSTKYIQDEYQRLVNDHQLFILRLLQEVSLPRLYCLVCQESCITDFVTFLIDTMCNIYLYLVEPSFDKYRSLKEQVKKYYGDCETFARDTYKKSGDQSEVLDGLEWTSLLPFYDKAREVVVKWIEEHEPSATTNENGGAGVKRTRESSNMHHSTLTSLSTTTSHASTKSPAKNQRRN